MKIDLLVLGSSQPAWRHGSVVAMPKSVSQYAQTLENQIKKSTADYFLFWDSSFELPADETIKAIVGLPGDVWHAGLLLGMSGLPNAINFVEPVWMLNKDPEIHVAATSWRLSSRACLVKKKVFDQLGGIDKDFESLEAAGLDLGCRFIRKGAFVRHVPELLKEVDKKQTHYSLSVYDEMRFILNQYGLKWLRWSFFRALFNEYSFRELCRAYNRLKKQDTNRSSSIYRQPSPSQDVPISSAETVSVLIPTLNRYSYLKNELKQLAVQSIKPHEIIIIDQTPCGERQSFIEEFKELPIRLTCQDVQGQCTAWNEAIRQATGKYVLFLGDDADKISPTFIESFLRGINHYKADMVAAYVEEKGADNANLDSQFVRVADTFPICMIRREAFKLSGLLDYAFDRGARADADLALRLLKKGTFMVFDPNVQVYHHRAPIGGLRTHKARVITRSSAKKKIMHMNIPSTTEMYLMLRHYSSRQIKEMCLMSIFQTFLIQGKIFKKMTRVIFGLLCFPATVIALKRNKQAALLMLNKYPKIKNDL